MRIPERGERTEEILKTIKTEFPQISVGSHHRSMKLKAHWAGKMPKSYTWHISKYIKSEIKKKSWNILPIEEKR